MLLSPKSFAVIGASKEKQKVGHAVFASLLNSKIPVYPINPNTKSILGVKCVKSILEIKGLVSHAVIAVPAPIVPLVLKECGAAGVKYVIIISSGFKEAGNNKLEQEVVSIAKEFGMRILGPNVLGIIVNPEFNASFFKGDLNEGGVSIISQSGALAVGILDYLISEEIGIRSLVSVGNMSDLNINDALKELLDDAKTKAVLIYAESLINGNEFMKLCLESKKPIFILKSGVSIEGVRAASSHTGSLAGNNAIYDAAFKQCNARRVNSISELLNAGLFSEKYGLLGNNALIITNAGGPGILMTDALSNNKIKLAKIPEELITELNTKLKGISWSKNNPIDLIGDATPERYRIAFEVIKNHEFYDYVIVLLTPQAMTQPLETAIEVIKFSKESRKPVIPCFIGGASIKKAVELMKKEKLIIFDRIEDVANTLANVKKL